MSSSPRSSGSNAQSKRSKAPPAPASAPPEAAFHPIDRSAGYWNEGPQQGQRPFPPPGLFPAPGEPREPPRPEDSFPAGDAGPPRGLAATGRALLGAEARAVGMTAPPGPDRIGALVVWLRERLGMTQVTLAREAGLSQSSLSQLESGSNARAETLYAVARTLGVSVSTLFGEPVEALAPEDAAFYRDFCDLVPETRHEIRQYVLFRWLQQAGDQFVRGLETRRNKHVAQHMREVEGGEPPAAPPEDVARTDTGPDDRRPASGRAPAKRGRASRSG